MQFGVLFLYYCSAKRPTVKLKFKHLTYFLVKDVPGYMARLQKI